MSEALSTGQQEAKKFIAAHAQLTDFILDCSDDQWHTMVPIEERTVAVMADHMAVGYELVVGWIEHAQAGEPIPGTRAEQDAENAHHAEERADVSREEVLAQIEKTAPRVAAVLAAVPQAVAEGEAEFGPAGGPLPVAQLMATAATHVTRHLGHVKEALASSS